VTRAVRWGRVARLAGPARVLVPVLIGAVALVAALLYPRSDVHGGVHAGPEGLAGVHPVVLDFRPSVAWGPHRHSVVLIVRPRRSCSVRIGPVTSSAPGRIEVAALERGGVCRGARRVHRFSLPLPTVPDPRHVVDVQVGSELLALPWVAEPHPRPHPPGSSRV
jgi:hypothetical protein